VRPKTTVIMWNLETIVFSFLWLCLDPMYSMLAKKGVETESKLVHVGVSLVAVSFYQFFFCALLSGLICLLTGEWRLTEEKSSRDMLVRSWLPRSSLDVQLLCLNLCAQVLQMAALASGPLPQAQLVRALGLRSLILYPLFVV
jgi:hypothetical protein